VRPEDHDDMPRDRRRLCRPRRRGARAQRRRVARRHGLCRLVVACIAWLHRRGLTLARAAARFGLAPRTLRAWRRRLRGGQPLAKPLGRPAEHASQELRQEILGVIRREGGALGVPSLQALFPDVARREIQELKSRWCYAQRRRSRSLGFHLFWTTPGTVWAMDHSDLPSKIDGCFGTLLSVRDLASGMQLAAVPLADASAPLVREVLEGLIAVHGAPLVIKSDNGSSLRSEVVRELLAAHGILPLYSPKATPQYNGACEAGIGSLKTRAEALAAARGRPGRWTLDDVEHARQQANALSRPFGARGPSPADLFERRCLVTDTVRSSFLATWRNLEQRERSARGVAPEAPLTHDDQSSIDRVAIRDALIQHGFLFIRRRRVSPRLPSRKAERIT